MWVLDTCELRINHHHAETYEPGKLSFLGGSKFNGWDRIMVKSGFDREVVSCSRMIRLDRFYYTEMVEEITAG